MQYCNEGGGGEARIPVPTYGDGHSLFFFGFNEDPATDECDGTTVYSSTVVILLLQIIVIFSLL